MSRCFEVTLPVTGEVHGRAALHGKVGDALGLFAIGDAAIVFPP